MNTGQVMLSIAAFAFLGTILISFNHLVLASNEDMTNSHDVLIASSIASTYLDAAQALGFDQKTLTSPVYDPTQLTDPLHLGPDPGEYDMSTFNDFDDLDGFAVVDTADANNGIYRSEFSVNYVDAENINVYTMQTFLKRLDIKTWRIDVPVTTDTVRMFTMKSYFKFN